MSYPNFDQGDNASQATLAGSTAADAAAIVMPDGHKEDAGVAEYGVPPEYPVMAVPDLLANVNPSAGDVGPVEAGVSDVVPQGPVPVPGVSMTATSTQQAPDNPGQRGTTGYGR